MGILGHFRHAWMCFYTKQVQCIAHWWPCGLRHCQRLLAVSHHCSGSNPTGTYEKFASDLGLAAGGFRWVLRFPPPVTTGLLRLNHNMAERVTKKKLHIPCTYHVCRVYSQCVPLSCPLFLVLLDRLSCEEYVPELREVRSHVSDIQGFEGTLWKEHLIGFNRCI